jgi:serine/threonine protein kinase
MAFSLKDFTKIEKLGEGGQGKVYRAVQISLNRKVVIKEIGGGLVESEEQLKWLENEATQSASLEHDNIVRIYDFGFDRGSFYLVMEYMEGLDFARLLAIEKFPKELGLIIMLLALRGLQYAHTKGIVHCDFKPNNILVSKSGRVAVTDFGMAYPDTKSGQFTTKGKIFLTPAFMPPEVATEIEGQGNVRELFSETTPVSTAAEAAERIKKLDIRRDIWSTGVILFRIIAGRFPFTGENIPELVKSILHTNVPSLEELAPELPPALAAAIGSCLQKRPDQRLTRLDPLIEPLEKFLLDLSIPDCGKEISAFFADAGAGVRRLEQKLLIYHNREWRGYKRAGNAARAEFHLTEAERYASLVLISAGVATGPLKKPQKRPRPLKSPAALAAAAAAAGAAAILLSPVSRGFIKRTFLPPPPAVAAAVKQPPVDERHAVSAPEPAAPTAESPVQIAERTPPPETTNQSVPAVTGALPALATVSAPPAPAPPSAATDTAERPNAKNIPLQKYGMLKISITPDNAHVFADEKLFSANDLASGKRLKTGTHTITALADGYEPYWGSLDIALNLTSELSISLVPVPEGHGYLTIQASAPSSMYIDGIFRGTTSTPLTLALRQGEHFVTLRCRGYQPFKQSITIGTGDTATLKARLEPSGR